MDYRAGDNPEPFHDMHADRDDRRLSPNERIEFRHWLQELSEHAKSVRNAMDPQHGVHTVTVAAWRRQWASMTREIDSLTDRL